MLGAGAPAERFGRSHPSHQIGPSRAVGSLSNQVLVFLSRARNERRLPLANPISPAAPAFPLVAAPPSPALLVPGRRPRRPSFPAALVAGPSPRRPSSSPASPMQQPTPAVVASMATVAAPVATTGAHRRAHRCARRRSSPACEQKKSSAQGDAQCCNLRRKKLQLAIGKASTGYEKSFNQYTTGAMDDQEKLQPVTEKASSSDEKSFIRL